jgi:microsomal dipeptidase-like Zn-dependent dipeptidase
MIRRCIADPQLGSQHVALGGDMDGSVKAAFAANHYALLTAELGALTETDLRDVMGGNVLRYFLQHLPAR